MLTAREELNLKEELHDLRMRLSAIKMLVTRVSPVCSEKFKDLLESCEGCNGDNQ